MLTGDMFEASVGGKIGEKLEFHLLPGKTDTSLAASPSRDLLNTGNLCLLLHITHCFRLVFVAHFLGLKILLTSLGGTMKSCWACSTMKVVMLVRIG